MLQTRLEDSVKVLKSLNKIKNAFVNLKLNELKNFRSTSSNLRDLSECMKNGRLDLKVDPVELGVGYAMFFVILIMELTQKILLKTKILSKTSIFVKQTQILFNSSVFNKQKRHYSTVYTIQYRSYSNEQDKTQAKPKRVVVKVIISRVSSVK
jgi:hypothetical protein